MPSFIRGLTAVTLAALALAPLPGCATQSSSTGEQTMQTAQAIEEGAFVDINGVPQWITVRGRDRSNPVLLILHGGPGFPSSQWAPLVADWEANYTVVQWDQPGGGATYRKNPEAGLQDLTIARYRRDGIAVAEWARAHLGARKIIVMGTSWGTLLGLEMIHARPDLFSAYVGASQVATNHSDPRLFDAVVQAARARGDSAAVAALERGRPPYTSADQWLTRQQYANAPAPLETAQRAAMAHAFAPPPPGATYAPRDLPDYDFIGVFLAVQRQMFPELNTYDISALGRRFDVPIFVFQGDSDLNTPASVASSWLNSVEAPHKFMAQLPGVGHDTMLFAPDLLVLMDTHVRPYVLAHQNDR